MRILLGLVLGLALATPPAVAGKPGKEDRKERKAERKAEEPPPSPVVAAAVPGVAEVTISKRRRRPPAPTPVPTADPAPAPAPAATPVATAVPTVAPVRAPARPRQRASSARPVVRRRPRPVATAAPAAAAVPAPRSTPAPVVTPVPTATPAPRPRPAAEVATVTRPNLAAETVTRVIRVIPTPMRFIIAALLLTALALAVRARRLERQGRGLKQDVGVLQSALLPVLPRRVGATEVSAAYRPAEGLAAGGDFYDAFALDDHRTCVIVGDVAGHGRDAIPLTADVRFTLRAFLERGMTPRAALRAAAEVLEPRLQGRTVTVIVAVYDAAEGTLTYAGAGHPPPLLVGAPDDLLTAGGCPPIGAGLETGLRQTTVALPPGAAAIFHTDGLTDILRHGRRMGRAGLAEAVRPDESAEALLERLVAGSESQPDDMAACILRPLPGAATAAAARSEVLHLHDDPARARHFLAACGHSGAPVPAGAEVLEVRDGVLTVRTADDAILPLG